MPAIDAPADLRAEAAFAVDALRPYFGRGPAPAGAARLQLAIGPVEGQSSPEAYELVVDPEKGVQYPGGLRGGRLLRLAVAAQLAARGARSGKGLALSALAVVDAPRFGYRGFMLDVARNFQPKASVLRTLDLLARYKLNRFHFHLTDDEGWRLEVPSLPELDVGRRSGAGTRSTRARSSRRPGAPARSSNGRGAAASSRAPTTSRSCAMPPHGTSR